MNSKISISEEHVHYILDLILSSKVVLEHSEVSMMLGPEEYSFQAVILEDLDEMEIILKEALDNNE